MIYYLYLIYHYHFIAKVAFLSSVIFKAIFHGDFIDLTFHLFSHAEFCKDFIDQIFSQ